MTQPQALIVEDEAIIAMMLQMFLEELGCAVQETASNVQDALRAASEGRFELAFLDVNLNGQRADAIPRVLAKRKIPFAFVTGYGAQGIPAIYAQAPIVTKPFSKNAIADTLASLTARSAT